MYNFKYKKGDIIRYNFSKNYIFKIIKSSTDLNGYNYYQILPSLNPDNEYDYVDSKLLEDYSDFDIKYQRKEKLKEIMK